MPIFTKKERFLLLFVEVDMLGLSEVLFFCLAWLFNPD